MRGKIVEGNAKEKQRYRYVLGSLNSKNDDGREGKEPSGGGSDSSGGKNARKMYYPMVKNGEKRT